MAGTIGIVLCRNARWRQGGDMRTVLASLDPITVNNEPCILAVSVDITEREERADALQKPFTIENLSRKVRAVLDT
jgi:hypothetical protein